MNCQPKPSRRPEYTPGSRAVRWLGPAVLVAFVPKCVLCVLAYAGLGTALGWGGAELCGAAEGAGWFPGWAASSMWLGLALGVVALIPLRAKALRRGGVTRRDALPRGRARVALGGYDNSRTGND